MLSQPSKSARVARRDAQDEWFALLVAHGEQHTTDDPLEIRRGILTTVDKALQRKVPRLRPGQTLAIVFRLEIINTDGSFQSRPSARLSQEAIQWRMEVFTRDGFKCQECGSARAIAAHHIESWATHVDRRFDVTNGITLCVECHVRRHPRWAEFIRHSRYHYPDKGAQSDGAADQDDARERKEAT